MFKKLIAGATAAATVVGVLAVASPNASATSQPASIVAALSASAANNRDGQATDRNPFDHDILLAAADALGLVPVLDGFTGTVFAPTDGAFRALVADLTNTPQWRLSEANVLDTLVAIAGDPDLNSTGIGGAAALTETVKYHVTAEQIPNLRKRARHGAPVDTITELPSSLSDGEFDLSGRFFVRLSDDDRDDRDPRWFGRTIRTADGGTVHVISGVLRPLDLSILFPAD
jgi:uncharacterized surface protein with fasciclin (FAS1) repeats